MPLCHVAVRQVLGNVLKINKIMILAKFWKNFYEINFDFYKTAKFCTKSFVPNFGKIRKTLYFLKKKTE